MDAADSILDLCNSELGGKIQEQQQEVVESWERLRMQMEQREEELRHARQRYLFLNTVTYLPTDTHFCTSCGLIRVSSVSLPFFSGPQMQDYSLWCAQVLRGMKAEESIRDVATCDLQLFQHQQLWAEIIAREETYTQAAAMGQSLQEMAIPNAREVSIHEGNEGTENFRYL